MPKARTRFAIDALSMDKVTLRESTRSGSEGKLGEKEDS